jgi:predicted transposase/invertase (TIGR01784 family)
METKKERKLITFDWAMKRLLRSKANFDILEGFLSELLSDDITIIEILESESNKETKTDKFNRVDIKVKNSVGEFIIIEVQYDRELDYLQRILYGTSRVLTEQMQESRPFSSLVKVISINILYFDLGHGSDYIYHGTTTFKGMHDKDDLQLDVRQKKLFGNRQIHNLFPEYYLIRINNFDNTAKTTLDEWIYFLKNEEIKEDFKARGIQKARKSFSIMNLPEKERKDYARYQDDLRYQASLVESNFGLGRLEGREEGIAVGVEKGKNERNIEIAIEMIKDGESNDKIRKYTGLTDDEIEKLRGDV